MRHWRADLALLRERDLRLVLASRLVSVAGSAMGPVALAFGVLALPGGSATSLGVVLFAYGVPEVLFMLLGGVVGDRRSRSRVLVLSESTAAAAQLGTAALFLTGTATVPRLAALAAVGGLAAALFSPAYTGLVPQVAPPDALQSANALLRLAINGGRIGGAAAGGLLVATIGPGWAIGLDGLSFALSAVLVGRVRLRPGARTGRLPGMLADLRQGWREFTSRRWTVVVVAVFSLANVGYAVTVGVLGPIQAKASLGGPAAWAVSVAASSAGTVAGVVVAMRVRTSRPLAVSVLVAPALALPCFALARPLPLPAVVVAFFVAGVSVDVFTVLWDTTMQRHVPAESLSRVSAYDFLGSIALVPLGLAAVGPVADVLGVRTTLVVAGTVTMLPVLAVLDPQVRGLRDAPDDTAGPAG